VITPKDKRVTAYHEAGHAVVACLLGGTDRPRRFSVVQRGFSPGYQLAAQEDWSMSRRELIEDALVVTMGGLAAEEILLGETSSAVAADLERATGIARFMVTRWGMSPRFGPVAAANGTRDLINGRPLASSPGDRTLAIIDGEVRGLLERALRRARAVLTGNLEASLRVAEELVARQELTASEVEAILDGRELPPLPDSESLGPHPDRAADPEKLRFQRRLPVAAT